MKKIIKWVLIMFISGIVLFFGFKFFVVSWLCFFSNPKRMETLPEEKILFDQLKIQYGFEKISRTPDYEMDFKNPKDTLSYELYISYIDCNKPKKDYEKIADSIFMKIKQNIDLDPKFYKYGVIFNCESRVKKDTSYVSLYQIYKLKKDVK